MRWPVVLWCLGVAAAACGSEADSLTGFIPAADGESPLAVVEAPPLDYELHAAYGPGELTVVNDCLFLDSVEAGAILLAWPSGSTEWSAESDAVRFTAAGESPNVVRVGDDVIVAGGESAPSPSWLQQPIGCPEGIWAFVTSIRTYNS